MACPRRKLFPKGGERERWVAFVEGKREGDGKRGQCERRKKWEMKIQNGSTLYSSENQIF